jgi:hypothetical protein
VVNHGDRFFFASLVAYHTKEPCLISWIIMHQQVANQVDNNESAAFRCLIMTQQLTNLLTNYKPAASQSGG